MQPIAKVDAVTDVRIVERIERRFAAPIQTLLRHGFERFAYTRESVTLQSGWRFPLFLLAGVIGSTIGGEVIQLGFPPRFSLHNPLLIQRDPCAYAHVFGLGALFITGFEHGGMLVTSSFTTDDGVKSSPQLGYFRVEGGGNLYNAWSKHQRELETLIEMGHVAVTEFSMAHFAFLSEENDRIILKIREHKKNNL